MAFSTIQGSGGAPDSFVGTSGVDTINIQNVSNPVLLGAQADNDVIDFQNFQALVSGYTLRGGQGNDSIGVTINTNVGGGSVINGNLGEDTINLPAASNSSVYGGGGNDTIAFTNNLSNALVNGNKNADFITVVGASSSSIFGGQGVDSLTVTGVYNATVIQGDNDADTLTLAAGGVATSFNNSTINGNEGNDSIVATNNFAAFTNSTIFGGSGNDTVNAAGNTASLYISGDDGGDNLTGGAGAATVSGGAGIDTIVGGNGANSLLGGADNDTITGGTGTDTITGGTGVDSITAGTGADRLFFAFGDSGTTAATVDQAAGFVSGTDTVAFWTGVAGAGTNYTESTGAANFAAASAAAVTALQGAGQLYYADDDGVNTFVFVATAAASGAIASVIQLNGITTAAFAATDIVA